MTDSPPISLVCLDLASIVIDGFHCRACVRRGDRDAGDRRGNAGLRPRYGQVRPLTRARAGRCAARPVSTTTSHAPRRRCLRSSARSARRRSGSELTFRLTSRTRWARRQGPVPRSACSRCCHGDRAASSSDCCRQRNLVPLRRRRAARLPLARPRAYRDAPARYRGCA